MTEADSYALIEKQVSDGQYFLAFDTYRSASSAGLSSLRLTLLGALALLRSGAVLEARRLLEPLGTRLESKALRSQRLIMAFQQAVQEAVRTPADNGGLASVLGQFLSELEISAHQGDSDEADSPEVLRLVSQIHVEIWSRIQTPADLAQAMRVADQASLLSDTVGDGLNAARLAAMNGQRERAARLAASLVSRLDTAGPLPDTADIGAHFQHQAMRAELAILLNDETALHNALQAANALTPRHLPSVVELLRQLDMLASAGVSVPPLAREGIRPPSLVVFAGQALDPPGEADPCFPPGLEETVARQIEAELDALGAEIGFSCASAGAELLFVEAMLDRGAEVHLFLPFSQEDFIRHRVAYAGGHWERRFRNACKLATSVSFATEEAFLGHDALLRFNNHLIQGMARAHATLNRSTPHLLAVWDYAAASGAGSAADFIDNWPEITGLHLIHLDELRENAPQPPAQTSDLTDAARPAPPPTVFLPQRTIRTMLFADIVGYSKLREEDLPRLWEGLESIKPLLEESGARLRLIESWGDAIYAVMDNSLDLATYAFALIDAVARIDTGHSGLSRHLQVRIGLHAGPVFEGPHPLTGRQIVYGSHVSRTARIEPVSLPGHVYASQQFVAMLLAEDSAHAHKARMTGQTHVQRYACEYLGMLSLAKNYGRQQVYHVRRTNQDPSSDCTRPG